MLDTKLELGPLQRRWVNRLKKHPERQLKGTLGKRFHNGDYKACCLGEAGLMMGTCVFGLDGTLHEKGHIHRTGALTRSYDRLGLRSSIGTVDDMASLATLNDDPDYTWTDIAYLIEAAPELFFTKSV